MRDKWVPVQPSTTFNPEQRRSMTAIALPDGKRLLIQGGYSNSKLVNQTIIYDSTTNSWKNALPYTEVNRGVRQM